MSTFVLNVPFAIEKRISFSALSSKMNRGFVWQLAMQIKQDLHTYNAPIYLRTECSERKKRLGPNKKKIREINSGLWMALRIWPASPFAEESGLNIYNPRIYWRTEILCVSLINKVIAYSFWWRERKRKYVSQWQTARSKWKWTSIATVPDLSPTTVKIWSHIISRYHLPLKVLTDHSNWEAKVGLFDR